MRGVRSVKPTAVAPIAHFVGSFREMNESGGGDILSFKYSYPYSRYPHLDSSLQSMEALVGHVYFWRGQAFKIGQMTHAL